MTVTTHRVTNTHTHPLDNPTWNALTGTQRTFAVGSGLARRFRPDISVFGGIRDNSRQAWDDLGAVTGGGAEVALHRRDDFDPPPGWTLVRSAEVHQMVFDDSAAITIAIDGIATRPLADTDLEQMLELVQLTEPGPFGERTIELGGYRGIFGGDGHLLAMAGRRIAVDEYVEISAVCTHPDARRRGYAAAATIAVGREILAEGKTPILHVRDWNANAIAMYERIGYVTRATMHMRAYAAPGQPSTGPAARR